MNNLNSAVDFIKEIERISPFTSLTDKFILSSLSEKIRILVIFLAAYATSS